jgi:uncharacterized protein YciI
MFVVICTDYSDGRAVVNRHTALAAHLAYIETIVDRILVAGPLRAAVGGGIVGSLLIYKVESEEEARALLEADPYFAADIWASVEFKRFNAAVGEWVSGTDGKLV